MSEANPIREGQILEGPLFSEPMRVETVRSVGEPEADTTSIDNAALAPEAKGFYIRKAGSDGFRFGFTPTLKKVVSDRRASLDDDEAKTVAQALVRKEFERGNALPLVFFPEDGGAVQDTPKLTLVVSSPE